jgi:deoxyhypusine synthase
MVDDERLPMREGERVERVSVRFRTLGCYPLTGATESAAASVTDVIREMLLDHGFGARRARRRSRRRRVDGEKEARGLFLMAAGAVPAAGGSDLIAADIEEYLRRISTRACCASSPADRSTTASPR